MSEGDIYGSNRDNPFAELIRQINALQSRIQALEAQVRTLSGERANPGVPASTFATAPAAIEGDIRWFTDKTFPGASFAGVLAVSDGTRWLTLGEDVSGF